MFSPKIFTRQAILGTLVGLVGLSQISLPGLDLSLTTFSRNLFTTNMSPALVQKLPAVNDLENIEIGRAIDVNPKGSNGPTLVTGKPWGLPAGLYTPRQIVEANAPLLETVIHHLGPSPLGELPAREQLIDNLASNLALNTREASITIPANDPSRVELAAQAIKIGETLIKYVRNVTDVSYDPGYVVRSPCEGHLLKPHVSYLMFGPRSLRHLMQIYNEYLHQMVLLRDALLPFDNYEDIIIPITAEPGCKRGMRHTEDVRTAYLAELLTKQVTQRSTIKAAQFLLAPDLSPVNSIGFQYQYGLVVPSFIAGGTSGRLLRYIPAVVDESSKETVFHNELLDYYTAPRSDVLPAKKGEADTIATDVAGALKPVGKGENKRLALCIEYSDGAQSTVDLGQSARGYRYAQFIEGKGNVSGGDVKEDVHVHTARSLLVESGPGLVIPTKGIHSVQASSQIELHALLGKIYPDNVVVKTKNASLGAALGEGKPGLPDAGRFVIEIAQ